MDEFAEGTPGAADHHSLVIANPRVAIAVVGLFPPRPSPGRFQQTSDKWPGDHARALCECLIKEHYV